MAVEKTVSAVIEILRTLRSIRESRPSDVDGQVAELITALRQCDGSLSQRTDAWLAISRVRVELVQTSTPPQLEDLLDAAISRTREWLTAIRNSDEWAGVELDPL